MKSIRLLLKNSFRTAYKNWTQLIGISILITLFAMIVSLLSDISSRVIMGHDNLNTTSLLHDFVVEQDNSNGISIDDSTIKKYLENTNLDVDSYLSQWESVKQEANQELSKQFAMEIIAKANNFSWTRTEGRAFNSTTYDSKSITVKAIVKTGMDNGSAVSDKLIISKGSNISTDSDDAKREVVIGTSFANQHNIQIGDIIRLQKDNLGTSVVVSDDLSSDKKSNFNTLKDEIKKDGAKEIDQSSFAPYLWFVVKGIGESADFSFPVIDKTTYIPDTSAQMIAYVDKSVFGLSSVDYNSDIYEYNATDSKLYVSSDEDREVFFSGLNNKNVSLTNNEIKKIQSDINSIFGYTSINKNVYKTGDSSYQFNSRVQTFNTITNAYSILSRILLIVIGCLTFVTIALMTKKQIDAIRKQVGTLKALGYKKRIIIDNFLAAPLLNSIFGCVAGYVLTFPIEYIIVSVFSKYFSITFLAFNFQIIQFLLGLFVTYIINLAMVFISGYAILNQPALELLKGQVVKQISRLGIKFKKIYTKAGFNKKLRAAIITSSFGKLFGIITTMLIGSFLMTMSVIAPKVIYDNKTASFEGVNYNSEYIYNSPIAANPLSFYKTYDYNSYSNTSLDDAQSDDWGFGYNKSGKISFGLTDSGNGYSAYPLDATSKIDIQSVASTLSIGTQPADYYSFNISSDSDANSFSNIASLNWKNISSSYLELLNNTPFSSANIVGKVTMANIYSQWTDYQSIVKGIKQILNSDSSNSKADFAKLMLWFYRIYTQGLKININQNIYSDNKLNTTSFKDILVNTNDGLYASLINKLKLDDKDSDASSPSFDFDLWNSICQNISQDEDGTQAFALFNGSDMSVISDKDIENESDEDIKTIDQTLLSWMILTMDNRLGTALLLNTYSKSPYYVQQEIIDAINNNQNYNISFGLIPYDPENDEIGTALDASYIDRTGASQSIDVFGLTPTEKLMTLNDSSGKNLLSKLFKTDNSIVINETVAKKLGLNVGDDIDLSVLKNVYKQKDSSFSLDHYKTLSLDDYTGSWNNQKAINALGTQPTTETSKSYTNNYAYTNSDVVEGNDFSSAKLGNYDVANKIDMSDVSSATQVGTPIHSAYSSGDIEIDSDSSNTKFKIVGIQNGYGTGRAWISNDKANSIMGYDKTQEYFYINYFLPEWFSLNDKAWFTSLGISSDSDLSNYYNEVKSALETTISQDEGEKLYSEIYDNKDSNEDYATLWNFFSNQYPVFNYKNSLSSDLTDITKGISSVQQLGDYSAVGLSGNLNTLNSDSSNQVKSFSDVNQKLSGLSKGAINIGYPLNVKEQILTQISDLVNMVMIMFIVLALIISSVIVLLITNLIIYENKEFIATMKIMGYSEKYVLKMIVVIYLIPLLITFIVGFLSAIFGFKGLVYYLAINSSWVLPFYFTWYIPFIVIGIISSIFVFSFVISYANIKKISPLLVLQS